MALNYNPPYLLYNVYSQKHIDLYNQIVPQLKKRLEERYKTEVTIDKDFVINYDKTKLNKDQVMKVDGQIFKEYYLNKNKG